MTLRGWPPLLGSPPARGYSDQHELDFHRCFPPVSDGYAAFVEELPGANTQGATLEEARANLLEAGSMVLEANRELAEKELRGQEVIREPLLLGPT